MGVVLKYLTEDYRPTRCVCVSISLATSKLITVRMCGISRPRAATSVATKMIKDYVPQAIRIHIKIDYIAWLTLYVT